MDDQFEHEAALALIQRTWEWMFGSVALAALQAGLELGLFERLQEDGPLRPAELAARLDLQPRPVETWAKVLVQHGLLVGDAQDRVRLAPGAATMLCPPHTLMTLSPSITFHAKYVARDLLELPVYLRDGEKRPPARHGPGLAWNIAEQTAAMHALFLAGVLPELPELEARFRDGADVLDVGCGTANLGVALCSAFDGVRYLGIDLDEHTVQEAQAAIAPAGYGERLRLVAGEVGAHAPPASFDVALLFLAYHEVAPGERAELLATVRRALRGAGVLVVFDEAYPATVLEAAEERFRMGLHFELTEMLWGTRVPTRAELEDDLRRAGFRPERRRALQDSVEVVLAWPT